MWSQNWSQNLDMKFWSEVKSKVLFEKSKGKGQNLEIRG